MAIQGLINRTGVGCWNSRAVGKRKADAEVCGSQKHCVVSTEQSCRHRCEICRTDSNVKCYTNWRRPVNSTGLPQNKHQLQQVWKQNELIFACKNCFHTVAFHQTITIKHRNMTSSKGGHLAAWWSKNNCLQASASSLKNLNCHHFLTFTSTKEVS